MVFGVASILEREMDVGVRHFLRRRLVTIDQPYPIGDDELLTGSVGVEYFGGIVVEKRKMQIDFLLFPVQRQLPASFSSLAMASSVVPPIANRLVHPIAHAFSISGANGIYNSARPSYPPAALAHLFSSFPTSPNQLSVAELGAGTGIFTRLLLANGIGRIRDLLVVEPSAGMREGFEKVVEAPGEIRMRVVDGTFDSIDSPDASMDAVLIAQAFHWIGQGATAGESAIKEVRHDSVRFDGNSGVDWDSWSRLREFSSRVELWRASGILRIGRRLSGSVSRSRSSAVRTKLIRQLQLNFEIRTRYTNQGLLSTSAHLRDDFWVTSTSKRAILIFPLFSSIPIDTATATGNQYTTSQSTPHSLPHQNKRNTPKFSKRMKN